MKARRLVLTAALAATTVLTLAGGAGAVHWPFFGGDAGRSGYQPVDKGGVPVPFVYVKSEGPVVTSVITGAGIPSGQRLIYGMSTGRIHLQILETGAAVGAEEGIDIANGDNADVLTGDGGSVTPGETSSATSAGQVYVVHNDDNQGGGTDDIAIAQIDASNGALVRDVPLPGTDAYTIASSVFLTGPDAGDGRSLFFIASTTGVTRLFKVPITNASAQAATIGTPTSVVLTGGNPLASSTLVFLNNSAGAATAYVAVPTASQVQTFAVADLSAGPVSGNLGGTPQTVSVPVTTSGATPGATAGATPTTAPSLFVAVNVSGTTVVVKLAQQANALATVATSAPLAGAPAPALAVTQEVPATGSPTGGKVIVTTAGNLFLLGADNLAASGTFGTTAQASPTGFARTTAAASGDFVYVTRDNGQQLVLKLADAQPVTAAEFTQNTGNTGSATAYGQPSISRGFVQFASDKGVFVHRNADLTAPTVALTAPAEGATISGTVTVTATALDARGVTKVDFQIDGATVASDTSGEGSSFASPGAAFSATFNAATLQNGSRKLTALATDGGGRTGTAERTVTVTGGQSPPPPPPPTPTPTPGLKKGNCANRKVGNARANVLRGTTAGDNIFGLGGNDTIAGLAGNDCLDGGTGNDVLVGGPGNDRLIGGTGNDTLIGGTGNDQLVAGTGTNRISGGSGADRINAVNGRPETVNCGSGRDTAFIDAGKDRVVGCEVLFRR